jgi:hypothetical protein
MAAEYWIAQHVADIFRNEPRNVGVIVSCEGQISARFFGEDDARQIDGRRIKSLPYPDVYRQWVGYWRHGLGDIKELAASTSGHYPLLAGGRVSGTEGASCPEVSEYLYSALVSEGAIGEALQERAAIENPSVQLETEVERSLGQANLLAADGGDILVVHPIRRHESIQGRNVSHRPAFSQQNGHLCLIETVDLSTPRKSLSRDHAGCIAYMYRDIRDRIGDVETLAVVRATDEDKRHGDVDYALGLLGSESRIVQWFNADEREAFIAGRREMAWF